MHSRTTLQGAISSQIGSGRSRGQIVVAPESCIYEPRNHLGRNPYTDCPRSIIKVVCENASVLREKAWLTLRRGTPYTEQTREQDR
jgi:hypothetical protein